jgi:hypothetical protein
MCQFVELGVFSCPLGGLCLGGGRPLVVRGLRVTRGAAPCRGKGRAHTRHEGGKVLACRVTGAAHHCGRDCDRATDTDDGLTVCALTRTVLEDLRRPAFDGWAAANMGKFAMTAVHQCSPSCSFAPLEVFRCPEFSTCIGGGLFPLVQRGEGGGSSNNILVAAKNKCFKRKHRHLRTAMLFVCMATGTPHYCGRTCERMADTHDGDTVCEFTGRVLRDLVIGRDSPLPAGCVFLKTSDFKTEYIRSEAGSIDLGRYYGHVVAGMRRKAGEQVREQVFNAALSFATQYITERAGATNRQRNASGDQAVRDAIDTYCARKLAPSFLALVHIAAAVRSSHPLTVALTMSAGHVRKHAWTIASRIVALMGALRHLVPGGKPFVDGMSLKSFFLLAVEMCRQGISVADTTLLSPDPILMLISRGDADAASFWKDHIDDRQAPKNLAKMPAQLRMLITRAVAARLVSPERLRIDEMTDHLQVATEGFEGYRKKD